MIAGSDAISDQGEYCWNVGWGWFTLFVETVRVSAGAVMTILRCGSPPPQASEYKVGSSLTCGNSRLVDLPDGSCLSNCWIALTSGCLLALWLPVLFFALRIGLRFQ